MQSTKENIQSKYQRVEQNGLMQIFDIQMLVREFTSTVLFKKVSRCLSHGWNDVRFTLMCDVWQFTATWLELPAWAAGLDAITNMSWEAAEKIKGHNLTLKRSALQSQTFLVAADVFFTVTADCRRCYFQGHSCIQTGWEMLECCITVIKAKGNDFLNI